jgi:hypothetical protein
MGKIIADIFLLLALPLVSFVGGAWIMAEMSNHQLVTRRLLETGQKPLNQRLGYGLAEVQRCWGALNKDAILAERRFLELDLVFPFVYGGAFVTSLLIAWALLSRPFNPLWFMAPVVITILADWVENLTQLNQIKRYLISGETGLDANWIRVASVATTVKWLFSSVITIFLLTLAGLIIARVFKSV